MAGISSKAANTLVNKKKFNDGSELQSEEFSDASGLEWYDVDARFYDPQIGRFMQVDPLSDEEDQESYTPYHYCFNNPVVHNDPDGKNPIVLVYRVIRTIIWLEKISKPKSIPLQRVPLLRDNTTVVQPVVIPPGTLATSPPTETTSTPTTAKKRSASDEKLIKEDQEKKAKEAQAKERAQKRQQQTKEGETKVGESNQGTRGSHYSGNRGYARKQKHDAAEPRRAREQAAADRKKKEARRN